MIKFEGKSFEGKEWLLLKIKENLQEYDIIPKGGEVKDLENKMIDALNNL